MPIRPIALLALLLLAACAQDVELDPLPPLTSVDRQESSVCDVRRYACDPYDPGSNFRCDIACGYPGHCLEYTSYEEDWCWGHPGAYLHGGYCSPFGEPTWPTHCVGGLVP